MMTREQEQVIDQALMRGIVKSHREAHEMGCAALRKAIARATGRRERQA
jgi:hypothetical protein